MIDLNFGLWWSGAKLSYLRYLTFKTLRHFHPHSRIQLYTNAKFEVGHGSGKSNKNEEQEYADPNSIKVDYMKKLSELGVEIIRTNSFSKYSSNHQSDFWRWLYLRQQGGFYLDTDQVILKSFQSLPLNKYRFVYSYYDVKSPYALDNKFAPVGVLGASKDSKIVKRITEILCEYYDKDDYNCIGPWMFHDVVKKLDMKEGFNAPSSYFYPAPICDRMKSVFDGSLKLGGGFSAHWYGGYGLSQIFNKKYTEEFAKRSNDSISKFLRERKLL